MSGSILQNPALRSFVTTILDNSAYKCLHNIMRCSSSKSTPPTSNNLATYKKESKPSSSDREFYTPSPYKNPGPRRYGHVMRFKTDGVLPRHERPVRSLPAYKPKDRWATKPALFGQNDYIDILGDGDMHPADLLTGPKWLIAFKGNERDRLMRKMEWEGKRLKMLYPTEYNRMEKRIRYLTKLYNHKRSRRWAD